MDFEKELYIFGFSKEFYKGFLRGILSRDFIRFKRNYKGILSRDFKRPSLLRIMYVSVFYARHTGPSLTTQCAVMYFIIIRKTRYTSRLFYFFISLYYIIL